MFSVRCLQFFGFFELLNIKYILRPSARFLCPNKVRSRDEEYFKIIQLNNFTIFPNIIELDPRYRHHYINSQRGPSHLIKITFLGKII